MSSRKQAKRARRPDLLEKRDRQHQKAIEFKQEQQRIRQERMNELLEKYVKSDEFKRREAEAKKESEEGNVSEETANSPEEVPEVVETPLSEVEVV